MSTWVMHFRRARRALATRSARILTFPPRAHGRSLSGRRFNILPLDSKMPALTTRAAALTTRAAALTCAIALAASVASAPLGAQSTPADKLIDGALKDSAAWNRLAELVDTFGNRPVGSTSLESAIDWIVAQMKKDGLDNVHTEPVMVPHWVRGRESATLLAPHAAPLHMLGLGRSIGTQAR